MDLCGVESCCREDDLDEAEGHWTRDHAQLLYLIISGHIGPHRTTSEACGLRSGVSNKFMRLVPIMA